MACQCSERLRPLSLPEGSNDRPRQWCLLLYKETCNGRDSEYSRVSCRVCGAFWKTRAVYAGELPICAEWPESAPLRAEPWDAVQ